MLLHTLLLGAFISLARADEVSDALSATPTASISNGQIVGTTTSIAGPTGSVAVNKFLGIPFAAPPTGEDRFAPPRAPEKWTSRDTKEFSKSCIQVFAPLAIRNFTEAVFNNPPPEESEDCLYLNVFAPKKAWDVEKPPYPVLFWMYGGGWKFGSAGLPIYDGSHFAGLEDVILVSVNYRTNAFGLPINPTIQNVTERNVAVLDQRAGLQWVQDNIHHFGGDKSRVTISGESAGAFATDLLVTSYAPKAPRPFQAAIMESGTYAYLKIPNCNNDFFGAWNLLAQELNCTGDDNAKFNCIKNNRTADDIKNAQERNALIIFAHACDNITVVSDPRLRLEAGNVADVPIILGTNTQDGSFYSILAGNSTDTYFATYLPNNETLKAAVLKEYPQVIDDQGNIDEQPRLQQIHTDWFFHCPAVWYGATSTVNNPTYRYLFNATFPNTRAQWPLWPEKYQGAYHSSEIPIVFTSYDAATSEKPAQDKLSEKMRTAWANFARDPKKAPLEEWPRVKDGESEDVLSFGTDGKAGVGPVRDVNRCKFWEAQGFRTAHL